MDRHDVSVTETFSSMGMEGFMVGVGLLVLVLVVMELIDMQRHDRTAGQQAAASARLLVRAVGGYAILIGLLGATLVAAGGFVRIVVGKPVPDMGTAFLVSVVLAGAGVVLFAFTEEMEVKE